MTIEEAIYDLRTLLKQVTDDSRFSDAYLLRKILSYRALAITERYGETMTINPDWLQRITSKKLSPVGSADNPNIPNSSIKLGKCNLPQTIPIGINQGLQMLYSMQRQKEIYKSNWPVLMNMIAAKDERLEMFHYYVRIGLELYVYKFLEEVDATMILDNVLEGYNIKTLFVEIDNIEAGVEYFIVSGSLREVGSSTTIYKKYETFTGSADAVYSGDAKIQESDNFITSISGQYFPLDSEMFQRSLIQILTTDFAIEERKIADIINDAADEQEKRNR